MPHPRDLAQRPRDLARDLVRDLVRDLAHRLVVVDPLLLHRRPRERRE